MVLTSCKIQDITEGSKELNIKKFHNLNPSLDIASELMPCSKVRLQTIVLLHLVKKFPHLWRRTFHYPRHKISPGVPILNHITPVHVLAFYLFKIHFNIALTFTPRFLRGLFRSALLTKTVYTFLFSPVFATCPTNLILLDLITSII